MDNEPGVEGVLAAEKKAATTINIRPPSKHTYAFGKSISTEFSALGFDFLDGTWHVSYTNLPLWKERSHVRITYSKLRPSASSTPMPILDDRVQYQKLGSSKTHMIHGVDKPIEVNGAPSGSTFKWRGAALLAFAYSDWEILGWGTDNEGDVSNDWIVTSFSKTMFTPAGIDIYTRSTNRLSPTTLAKIKSVLEGLADEVWDQRVKEIYEVPRDTN
jgi:hypothetical protein